MYMYTYAYNRYLIYIIYSIYDKQGDKKHFHKLFTKMKTCKFYINLKMPGNQE